ncbi:MAG: hypothetical protein ACLTSZ_08185 [Lachnospiraceae bacterium]
MDIGRAKVTYGPTRAMLSHIPMFVVILKIDQRNMHRDDINVNIPA